MTAIKPPTALPHSVLELPEMREALAAHDFGTVFQLARQEGGISYSKIAAECGIKPERVGALARGQGRVESYAKIAAIADALRVPGSLVGLAARPWETSGQESIKRRDALQAAGALGLAASLPDILAPSAPRRIGSSTVARLRERAARLRRLDDVLGGGDTYRVYVSEYQETKRTLRTAITSEGITRDLLALLAEQAQQAGWAAFDGGRAREATTLYRESQSAAAEAGAGDLARNALAFLAYQATDVDPRVAAGIAARSCQAISEETPATVRALLWERCAWACAVAGEAGATERALGAAREALAAADAGEPQPDWSSWVDQAELDIMAGRCWTTLRRPLRAVPLLVRALADFDDAHARDKALYSTWLAEAYATAGEVEEAVTVTVRAAELADGVASTRPRRRIGHVVSTLVTEYPSVPAVVELVERVN
ncbi:helix-turn-helix domain-containing protein [Streptomyces sp. SID10815]|uniref:helix-turn-helix domain-containing protein n=1 Tax=Streptomyces sp. SID10815 TaxID=2706027 RepID=UPI0013C8A752|nr:helix-turn-helix domain-containing protein [Streptomyces sp. SID10815]NEA51600.1 helix-turn-helix transcriptional regulator [Streptomyces sp. SID10815]